MAGTFVQQANRQTLGDDGQVAEPIGYVFKFTADAADHTIPTAVLERSGRCTSVKIVIGTADSLTPTLSDMDGTALGIGGAAITADSILVPIDGTFIDLVGRTTISLGSSNTVNGAVGYVIINM